jgi:hypothetical protein
MSIAILSRPWTSRRNKTCACTNLAKWPWLGQCFLPSTKYLSDSHNHYCQPNTESNGFERVGIDIDRAGLIDEIQPQQHHGRAGTLLDPALDRAPRPDAEWDISFWPTAINSKPSWRSEAHIIGIGWRTVSG